MLKTPLFILSFSEQIKRAQARTSTDRTKLRRRIGKEDEIFESKEEETRSIVAERFLKLGFANSHFCRNGRRAIQIQKLTKTESVRSQGRNRGGKTPTLDNNRIKSLKRKFAAEKERGERDRKAVAFLPFLQPQPRSLLLQEISRPECQLQLHAAEVLPAAVPSSVAGEAHPGVAGAAAGVGEAERSDDTGGERGGGRRCVRSG